MTACNIEKFPPYTRLESGSSLAHVIPINAVPLYAGESKNVDSARRRWEKVISARALKHILFHDADAHRYIGTHSGS